MRSTVAAILLLFGATACSGQSLAVGDCFDDWASAEVGAVQQIDAVPIVDCADPHDNELYLIRNLPDGPFPGDAGMEQMAIDICFDTFESFVGAPYADSILDFGFLMSTEQMWKDGDRKIYCFVWHSEFLKLNDSMRNSGI